MSNTRRLPRRKSTRPPVTDLPAHIEPLINAVMAADAAYFAQHPTVRAMNRRYVPGEAWPYAAPIGSRVQVVAVRPGVRLRTFADGNQVLDVDEPQRKAAA